MTSLALGGLFPGEVFATLDLEPRHQGQRGLARCGKLRDGFGELADLAVQHLQEPDADFEGRLAPLLQNLRQNLRLHRRRIALAAGKIVGKDAAECPALAVLDRRGAVWIEQVALVEHGVGDSADAVEVHGGAAVRCRSSRSSTARSKVGNPFCRL